jgi:murein tripeptide amidase MpaA
MELLTITSVDHMTEEHEPIPKDCAGLFPLAEVNPESRAMKFTKDKPVVFLTSRVHPGETPGTFVLNGFLDLLTDNKNEQARLLRKHFVFKVIPCLNPDGCARGYYRLDTMAYNLNRYYLDPSKQNHPTIWAAK